MEMFGEARRRNLSTNETIPTWGKAGSKSNLRQRFKLVRSREFGNFRILGILALN